MDLDGVRRLAEIFTEDQITSDLVTMLSGVQTEDGFVSEPEVSNTSRDVGALCDTSRFVLVSSLGVTRPERFPQLEQMGSLLTYKLLGENALRASGCPFTIIRPGGFNDGPAGCSRIVLDQGDRLVGTIRRADVAELCAEAIFCPQATNITFECVAANVPVDNFDFGPHLFEQLVPDVD